MGGRGLVVVSDRETPASHAVTREEIKVIIISSVATLSSAQPCFSPLIGELMSDI